MLKLNQVHNFDIMSGLQKLPSESVDMMLTSPPYWSMRDYGKAATAIWGGDKKCEHDFSEKVTTKRESGTSKTAQVGNHQKKFADFKHTSQFCCKCGAWRGQLGLEPSIDLYIEHPHLLSAAALGNTYSTICLNQKDPMDINKAAAVSLVDSDEKNIFSMLPVGQGVVKLQDRWTKPFLVKFPLVDVKKGLMTDDMLARYFARNEQRKTGSMRKTSKTSEFERVPRVPMYDIALDDGEICFMEDVLAYPDDGVASSKSEAYVCRRLWMENRG